MAIKTIEYKVNIAGIAPATEQFGGTQGDHRVTSLSFDLDDYLHDTIEDAAVEAGGKPMYRFDVYDGEGGMWSSDAAELTESIVSIELEERHTRHSGKITVYLVITALSADNETQVELYSFPAVIRLKNRPEGTYQDGENYESVTSLAEVARGNALAAEKSNKELQAFAADIEEKLKNGEFDGVGVESAVIINDELIIKYTDGKVQNLGNVKGDTGPQGEKGDKGDAGKDAVTDQTYNPESENAQSGKAVAEAVSKRIPKPIAFMEPFPRLLMLKPNIESDTPDGSSMPDSAFDFINVDDPFTSAEASDGRIPIRDGKGNLRTGEPVEDEDCVSKKYLDDLVGDIETLLGGI